MRDITFELTLRDQVRATRAISLKQPGMWIGSAIFPLLLIWLFWTDYQTMTRGRRVNWGLTTIGVVTLVIGASFVYLSPYLTAWSYRRGNKVIAGPHTYRFFSDRLSMNSPLAATDLTWPPIREVSEDDRFVFFFMSKAHAAVLPKRALQPGELEEPRTRLTEWCGDAANLRQR
ncbi:MAG: hypothetical protein DMF78_12490 [Acidobacteria bacterium]|nr:MAG: hypothetical protein DMF78_12490 [Acidobacteriota bacterium]